MGSDGSTLGLPSFARLLLGVAMASACGLAWTQKPGIYTCEVNGKRQTSDRVIPECSDRPQRVLNPDGSLRVVGFDPTLGFYENSPATLGHAFGVRWLDETGGPALASDPAWLRFLTWQKELVDWFGVADLAYEIGTFEESFKDAKGSPVKLVGKYVVVWKRSKAGTWQLFRDIWNESPAR